MRSSAVLAVWLAIGLASPAEARPSGHLCPKDEGAIDPGPHPNETQLFGCLDKEFELVPVSIKGARRAIAIAGDPTSRAAAFRYHSRKQRNRQITRWWRQLDASAQRYRPSHANLNNWTYQYRRFPSGFVSFAMHRAGAKSGVLCVTKTDGRITPQAITVLNNWCLEWGGFWTPKHRPARS